MQREGRAQGKVLHTPRRAMPALAVDAAQPQGHAVVIPRYACLASLNIISFSGFGARLMSPHARLKSPDMYTHNANVITIA